MRDWPSQRVAQAAGARLVSPPPRTDPPGPARVTIDSRDVGRGDLFVGLPGRRVDGGRFGVQALA
ncbi:MAG: Mur ligase domain-containing protein, partial [Actinomycetota bacterium]|nr:Mur ligase domain-containing protein [Actinomycetota bacterium]